MGKRNPWLTVFANNKNVGGLDGKFVAIGIFHVNYTERSLGLSFLVITPILPRLTHSVTIYKLPVSNLMESVNFQVSKSMWMMKGSGELMVWTSGVIRWRIPFVSTRIFVTLHNLDLPSSDEIQWIAKWLLVSQIRLKFSSVLLRLGTSIKPTCKLDQFGPWHQWSITCLSSLLYLLLGHT